MLFANSVISSAIIFMSGKLARESILYKLQNVTVVAPINPSIKFIPPKFSLTNLEEFDLFYII